MDKNQNIIIAINSNSKVCVVLICKVKVVENHINLKDARILWVDELGIKEEFKRQRIGKELMNKAKEIAKKRKLFEIRVKLLEFQ